VQPIGSVACADSLRMHTAGYAFVSYLRSGVPDDDAFDAFLRRFIDDHAFGCVTSGTFSCAACRGSRVRAPVIAHARVCAQPTCWMRMPSRFPSRRARWQGSPAPNSSPCGWMALVCARLPVLDLICARALMSPARSCRLPRLRARPGGSEASDGPSQRPGATVRRGHGARFEACERRDRGVANDSGICPSGCASERATNRHVRRCSTSWTPFGENSRTTSTVRI
jgi:hypothetical protein